MIQLDGKFDGIIIDLDAVKGRRDLIDSLSTTIRALKSRGKNVRYASKDPSTGTDQTLTWLNEIGLVADADDLFLATNVLAKEIVRRENRATVFLIGSEGLRKDLHAHGLRVIDEPKEIDYLADFVVVGMDENCDYAKLTNALRCLDHGAQWAATGNETTVRIGEQLFPGTGVLAAAVQAMAGRKPDLLLGQPKSHVLRHAIRSADIQPEGWTLVTSSSSPLAQAASALELTVTPI